MSAGLGCESRSIFPKRTMIEEKSDYALPGS